MHTCKLLASKSVTLETHALCRKSDPMIGVQMSAVTKIEWNAHLSSKSSMSEWVLKVVIIKSLKFKSTTYI